jgi:hypothetical protein
LNSNFDFVPSVWSHPCAPTLRVKQHISAARVNLRHASSRVVDTPFSVIAISFMLRKVEEINSIVVVNVTFGMNSSLNGEVRIVSSTENGVWNCRFEAVSESPKPRRRAHRRACHPGYVWAKRDEPTWREIVAVQTGINEWLLRIIKVIERDFSTKVATKVGDVGFGVGLYNGCGLVSGAYSFQVRAQDFLHDTIGSIKTWQAGAASGGG